MSARIAPLPDGMGVAAIADKQNRRRNGDSKRAPTRAADAKAPDAAITIHAVPGSDESLPAGTLFTATVLSSGISVNEAALTELRIRRNRGWNPPESILRLRDKTI